MTSFPTPGRYRHFKGNYYEVIDVARHSETEQWLVVYRPLYGDRKLWVRPLEIFQDLKDLDGQQVPRFNRIADPDSTDADLQDKVSDFCQQHGLNASPAARLLDLSAELGELAKVWLQGSDYGRRTEAEVDAQAWQSEFGDTLFALLALANESGVRADQCLLDALERYQRRIERAGHPGSGAEISDRDPDASATPP